jgi:peptide/nickel transport system permease protein
MTAFIIRRLLQSIVIIFLVTISVFLCMRLLPGDPIFMLFSPSELQTYTEEELAAIRHKAGLDKPLPVQYFSWIGGVFRGDLGKSIMFDFTVSSELAKRIPVTAYIGSIAFIIGTILGVSFGVISAIKRGSWIDSLVTTLANLGITIPTFWLGVMLIFFFAIDLRWLPVMGFTNPFIDFWDSTRKLVMPVICMVIPGLAGYARYTRSSMLEVLRQDYIRTAWSKGLRQRVVIMKHAMKNGLIPIVTLTGMGIGGILGGSVMIEQVFNIPGMGRLAVEAMFTHDYAITQGLTLVFTGIVIFSNLLVDISYVWLDPRIRFN